MKLTAQIKLKPSKEQHVLLLQTLERANEACDWISGQAWEAETFSQYKLHDVVYHPVRDRFELSAQMTVRAISKVADAYKTNPDTQNRFSIRGGFPYDSRLLTYFTDRQEVTIWTLGRTPDGPGRERMKYVCGERQRKMLENQQGESDLVYHRDEFYLLATCNIEEPDEKEMDDVLGVDLGITKIATDSDGESWSGKQIEFVDPAYTSRTCSQCGHCEKANRRSQSEFVCRSCKHSQNADVNAALNIAAKVKEKGEESPTKQLLRIPPSCVSLPKAA